MRTLESSISLSVESACSPGARNDYAELPSIMQLAELATENPMILQAIGPEIAVKCNFKGYSEDTLADLRAKVLLMSPSCDVAKATVEALRGIATDYASEVKSSQPGKPPEKIPGLFTSGITEAIVSRMLTRSGCKASDITEDAIFFQQGAKLSSRNLDFVWAETCAKTGVLHECKNQPAHLIKALIYKERPGGDSKWEKSELWLMLKVHRLLSSCGWSIRLNVITLRSRGAVLAKIKSMPFITVPAGLSVIGFEDLDGAF